MRNLKRVLSLVLASIMLIGMMVVGAGAVDTYNDFSDKDEIVNKDAVSLLVTLDVINGKEDGSYFDPTGDVTRAEMAKMISVILNRGADINNQYATLNNGLTDIANNWAVGHINYCYSLDIIAGRGDGRFDPTANVTAVEAAKMLLSAAGYDASIEGMIGPNWDTNTAGLASRLGIFENFEKDITQPLNRDDAALLIYNFLDIEMIQSYENGYAIAFGDSRTVLSFAYGVIKVQGVVVANEWATVNSKDGDDALRAGKTTIYNGDGIFSTTTNTQTGGGNNGLSAAERALRTGTFNVATPEDYLGKSVTIYIRKTTILADSIVYGQPVLTDDNIVVETGAQVKEGERTVSGTLKKLLSDNNLSLNNNNRDEDRTLYFHNYDEYVPGDDMFTDEDGMNSLYNAKGATLTVIDNDGDGVVDYVLSKEKTLSQINAYSDRNETMNIRGIPGSLDFKEVLGYDDMAKDDIVFYVQYGGRTYVEQPETITGEMELYNVKGTEKYIRIEGEKYEEDGLKVAANTDPSKFYVIGCEKATTPKGEISETESENTLTGVDFDNTYEFFLDDYGNITAFRLVEGTPAKYALVLNSAFSTNGLKTTGDVKLLLSDNTTSTYAIDWSASVKKVKDFLNDNEVLKDGQVAFAKWTDDEATEYLKQLLGTDDGRQGATQPYPAAGQFKGNLVTYTLNEDNVATIGLPVLALGQLVSKGVVVTTAPTTTPNPDRHDALDGDLSKGDVDLKAHDYTRTGDTTTTDTAAEFGIDADTVVFYYHADGSSARIGYDEMARKIDDNTAVTVVAKKGDTDVAAAILLYPSGAIKFGTDNYVFVLREYNKTGSEYRYNVVDKEGNVSEVKAKSGQSGVATELNKLNKDNATMDSNREGLLYIMNMNGEYAEFEEPVKYNTLNHTVVEGIVRFEKDSRNYIRVYTDYEVVGANKDTVEINENGPSLRLPVRSLENIFDVDTLRVTDEEAVTTKLDNGMLVAIAYDVDGNNRTVISAYVEEFYKMDVDDEGPAPIVEGVFVDLNDPTDVQVYHTAADISEPNALAAIENALLADSNITEITKKTFDSQNSAFVFTVMTKSGFTKDYIYAETGSTAQVYTGTVDNVAVFVPTGGGKYTDDVQKQSDCSPLAVTGTYAYGKLAAADSDGYRDIDGTDAITGNGFDLETGYYKITLALDKTGLTTNNGTLDFTATINGEAAVAYVKNTKSVTIKLVTKDAAVSATHRVQGKIGTDSGTNAITAPAGIGTPADWFAVSAAIGAEKEFTVTVTNNFAADDTLTVTLTETNA